MRRHLNAAPFQLALRRHPRELNRGVGVNHPVEQAFGEEGLREAAHLERKRGATQAFDPRQHRHVIRAEAERREQPSCGDLTLSFRRAPVFHFDGVAARQPAVELRRRVVNGLGYVVAFDDRRGIEWLRIVDRARQVEPLDGRRRTDHDAGSRDQLPAGLPFLAFVIDQGVGSELLEREMNQWQAEHRRHA